MNPISSFTVAVLAAGILVSQVECGATAYDPSAEFSLNSNPNGVWSYGYSATLAGPMTLYPNHTQNGLGVGLYTWYSLSSQLYLPGILVNPTPNTITYAPPGALSIWDPYEVCLHPGPGGEFSILRFTAPADGLLRIEGQYSSIDQYYGATTDVHILLNGQSVLNDKIAGRTAVVNFDTTLQALAGDKFDFVVGPDIYGNGWDATGIRLSIATVPEPSALGLLLLGLALTGRRLAKR